MDPPSFLFDKTQEDETQAWQSFFFYIESIFSLEPDQWRIFCWEAESYSSEVVPSPTWKYSTVDTVITNKLAFYAVTWIRSRTMWDFLDPDSHGGYRFGPQTWKIAESGTKSAENLKKIYLNLLENFFNQIKKFNLIREIKCHSVKTIT